MAKQVFFVDLKHFTYHFTPGVFAEYWLQQLKRDSNSFKDETWQQDFVLTVLADNFETFFNYAKVIREILLYLSRPPNNSITEQPKTNLIKILLKNVSRKQFLLNYLPKYCNDKEYNTKSGHILVNIIANYHPTKPEDGDLGDSEFIKRGIETGLAIWSEAGFVQNASIKHLKCKHWGFSIGTKFSRSPFKLLEKIDHKG